MSKSRDLGEFPAAALDIDAAGNVDVTGTVTADGLTVGGRGTIYSGVLSEQSQFRIGYNASYNWSLGR